MADGLEGLQLLGNLLSYPKLRQNQAEQERMNAIGLQLLSGKSLEEAQAAVAPVEPPSKFGQVVGGVGSAISTILGNPIKPPRADLGELGSAVNVAEGQRRRKEFATIADSFTDPKAQAAARAGNLNLANQIESGGGVNEEHLIDRISRLPLGKERDRLANNLVQVQAAKAARAQQAARIQTGEVPARAAATRAAEGTQRREEEGAGKRFLEPYLRPQSGAPPTQVGGMRNIGYSLAAETPQGQFAGMVPTRGTYREGTGEVGFENPAAKFDESTILSGIQAGVAPGQVPSAADVGTMRSIDATEAGRKSLLSRSPTRTDLLMLQNGIDPFSIPTPEQAGEIGRQLDAIQQSRGPQEAMRNRVSRIRGAKVALQRLQQPVRRIDKNTGQYLVDAQGNPVYLLDARGQPMRAVDILTDSTLYASIPWLQSLSVEWQRKEGNEAAALLQQAVGEVAGFVLAAGDTGNAADKEQARQLLAFIPSADGDTVGSAVNKVMQGIDRLEQLEAALKSDIRTGSKATDVARKALADRLAEEVNAGNLSVEDARQQLRAQ